MSDSVISLWRLQPSETKPAVKMETASAAVDSETVRLLCAGVTLNADENDGSSGCTQ